MAPRQLSVKWTVDLKSNQYFNNPNFEPALVAVYKGRQLRMTAENGLYIGWIDGVKKISAESKGELYRKYMDVL